LCVASAHRLPYHGLSSAQFSEIIGPTLIDVIATMLLNSERTLAAGIPVSLVLPPSPPSLPTVPNIGSAPRKTDYEVADDMYDEVSQERTAGGGGGDNPYNTTEVQYGELDAAAYETTRDRTDSDAVFVTEVNDLYGQEDPYNETREDPYGRQDEAPPARPPLPPKESAVVYGDADFDDALPPPPARPPKKKVDPIMYGDIATYDDPPPPRDCADSEIDYVGPDAIIQSPTSSEPDPLLYGDPDDVFEDPPPPPRPAKADAPPPRPPK
jgi:hypothetical protein